MQTAVANLHTSTQHGVNNQEDYTMENQAYYWANRKAKFVLIHQGGKANDRIGTRYDVASMREARQIAQQHNARPWNF